MKITPILCFFILIVLQIITIIVHPGDSTIDKPYNYLGIILIMFGAILNIWTEHHFRKNKTTLSIDKEPTKLLTEGPFKISRNPMYFGMMLALFGVSISIGSLITFLYPVLFLIITEIYFIPHEEKILEKRFGKKYKEYKSKVRKYL